MGETKRRHKWRVPSRQDTYEALVLLLLGNYLHDRALAYGGVVGFLIFLVAMSVYVGAIVKMYLSATHPEQKESAGNE